MNEFELILTRDSDNGISTLGELTIGNLKILTLEDAYHKFKIPGKTRIPAGRYEIKLREFGTKYEQFKERYPFHRGMLWLQDVPDFVNILIHIGNHAGDTSGCILTGSHKINADWVDDSEKAYLCLYGYCLCLFDSGSKVFIKIIDS